MGKTYLVCDTDTDLLDKRGAIAAEYMATERAARGLQPDAGLDLFYSEVGAAPVRVTVTTGDPVIEKLDGVAGGLILIDALVLSMDAKGALDVVAVDEKALPAKFAPIVEKTAEVVEKVVK